MIDPVVLDIALPDENGYAICTEIKRNSDAPVIFFTAMADEASIITGFRLGGDDYVIKPFHPKELMYLSPMHYGKMERYLLSIRSMICT